MQVSTVPLLIICCWLYLLLFVCHLPWLLLLLLLAVVLDCVLPLHITYYIQYISAYYIYYINYIHFPLNLYSSSISKPN
jgi:hypothetical protein